MAANQIKMSKGWHMRGNISCRKLSFYRDMDANIIIINTQHIESWFKFTPPKHQEFSLGHVTPIMVQISLNKIKQNTVRWKRMDALHHAETNQHTKIYLFEWSPLTDVPSVLPCSLFFPVIMFKLPKLPFDLLIGNFSFTSGGLPSVSMLAGVFPCM